MNAYSPYSHCDRCQKMTGHVVTLHYPDTTQIESLLCVRCFVYYKPYMTPKMRHWFESFRQTKVALGQA
jgi:hypothetical protein